MPTVEIVPPSSNSIQIIPAASNQIQISAPYSPIPALSPGYKEFSYSGGNLSQIDLWNSASKTTLLTRTTLAYSGNDLAQKVVANYVLGKTITTTYTYSGGNLVSISDAIG